MTYSFTLIYNSLIINQSIIQCYINLLIKNALRLIKFNRSVKSLYEAKNQSMKAYGELRFNSKYSQAQR